MEPEFTQTTKKIKHQKSSSFLTLKRAKKEWKKLFKQTHFSKWKNRLYLIEIL